MALYLYIVESDAGEDPDHASAYSLNVDELVEASFESGLAS